jgi:hypothetical protein
MASADDGKTRVDAAPPGWATELDPLEAPTCVERQLPSCHEVCSADLIFSEDSFEEVNDVFTAVKRELAQSPEPVSFGPGADFVNASPFKEAVSSPVIVLDPRTFEDVTEPVGRWDGSLTEPDGRPAAR